MFGRGVGSQVGRFIYSGLSLAEIDGGRGNLMTVFERLSFAKSGLKATILNGLKLPVLLEACTTEYVDRWDLRRYALEVQQVQG